MITSCQNKPKPIIEQKSVKKIENNALGYETDFSKC